jgi:type IV secretion system protein VirD4
MSDPFSRAIITPVARLFGCIFWAFIGCLAVSLFIAWTSRQVGLAGGLGLVMFLSFAATKYAGERRAARLAVTEGSHGSARWGDPRPHVLPAGLILGRDPQSKQLVRYQGDGHLLTVAPTGSGKGVSAVIPNLLEYPGSVVVIDLKGENYAISAEQRARLGPVVALDPFDLVGGTGALNVLDLIDAEDLDADADAGALANLLVLPNPEAHDAHWDEEAASLLQGLILYVVACEPEERRHLGTVREYLSLPPDGWNKVLQAMADSDAIGGLIARAANRLAQKEPKERSSVVSTAQRHTKFLDTRRLGPSLRQSSFSPADLKRRVLSVYLIFPPPQIGADGRWLRLMVGSLLLELQKKRNAGRPAHQVLFMLDEIVQLGRLQPVEQGLTLLRGYGVQFWLLVQDLAQVRATYAAKAESLIANAQVLQAFGTSDQATAEYISKMTGQATVRSASENTSKGSTYAADRWSPNRQSGTAQNTAEVGRALLMPDEVRRLDRREALVFIAGNDPLRLLRTNYLTDAEFAGRYTANPMMQKVV